jgi:hypothetical protein
MDSKTIYYIEWIAPGTSTVVIMKDGTGILIQYPSYDEAIEAMNNLINFAPDSKFRIISEKIISFAEKKICSEWSRTKAELERDNYNKSISYKKSIEDALLKNSAIKLSIWSRLLGFKIVNKVIAMKINPYDKMLERFIAPYNVSANDGTNIIQAKFYWFRYLIKTLNYIVD